MPSGEFNLPVQVREYYTGSGYTAMNLWQRLINIPTNDPDDARRRRLLNVILVGLMGTCLVALLFYIYVALTEDLREADPGFRTLTVILSAMVVFVIIYWVGSRWSGMVGGAVLLVLLMALVVMSDLAAEVAAGRSAIYFVIPIILASMLVHPSASFGMAAVAVLLNMWLARQAQVEASFFLEMGYFIVALIAWLATSTLEQTLKELRRVNRELDQRVAERTTELRQALLRQQAETGRLQAILHSIADGVLVLDPVGKISAANPALGLLAGQPAGQIAGQQVGDWLARTLPSAQLEVAQALFRDPLYAEPVSLEWGDKVFSLNVAPVRLDSGEMAGAVAVFHDVTREVEIGRMKSNFVAMVSHDLRSPLTAILGLVEWVQQGAAGAVTDEQADMLARVVRNVHQLNNLVSDLLDQARIEAGTLAIQNFPFAPFDLMNGINEAVRAAARDKNLELITEISPDLPTTLIGDVQRLDQVLGNLLTNAVKFTEQGRVCARCYRMDEYRWALEVSDTGRGIPPEAQEAIFEPFRQLETGARKRQGVGLGLSIVKKLVGLMGGKIHLTSEVDKGSTFTAVFPLIKPD